MIFIYAYTFKHKILHIAMWYLGCSCTFDGRFVESFAQFEFFLTWKMHFSWQAQDPVELMIQDLAKLRAICVFFDLGGELLTLLSQSVLNLDVRNWPTERISNNTYLYNSSIPRSFTGLHVATISLPALLLFPLRICLCSLVLPKGFPLRIGLAKGLSSNKVGSES